MARTTAGTLPSLRLHKKTGQAVVTLTNPRGSRRDYYLGKPGEDTKQRYQQLLAAWIAAGNEFPSQEASSEPDLPLTIRELTVRFERWAEEYYRRSDGTPTGEHLSIKRACDLLNARFGDLHHSAFGPGKLIELQEGLTRMRHHVERDDLGRERPGTGKTMSRCYINSVIRRIKQLFKWAEAQELVAPSTYHRLATVAPLKAGRSRARESSGLAPVTRQQVEATVAHLSRQVAALIWFCWHTGARMGEAVQLATRHVERKGDVWLFRPPQHKNVHRGQERVIPIGKEAQVVLRPFLQVVPDRRWFRPCDVVAEQNEQRMPELSERSRATREAKRARRRTPQPLRQPGEEYSTNAVQIAIRRVCERERIPLWTPHMLRHAALSRIREERGIEAAAAIGGHWTLDVTQIYTRAAQQKLAVEVMRELG